MYFKLLAFLLVPITAISQVTIGGGKGLVRVYEADPIEYGSLYTSLNWQGFAGKKTPSKNALNELYVFNLNFTLGLPYQIDAFAHFTPYHDDQRHIFGPPGDTRLGLKWTAAQPMPSLSLAVAAYAQFPTAKTHPLPFEPYSEDATGWAILAALSNNLKNSSLALPLKTTVNFGYKDHNFTNDVFGGVTDQWLGGIAIKFPVKTTLWYSEISGEFFYNKKNIKLFENSVRFTQGVKFYGPYQILFDITADIDLSHPEPPIFKNSTVRFYEDYADWRIMASATYSFKLFHKKNLIKEQREQIKKNELNEIEQQRKNINQELEDYKKRLKKEKKKNPPL